MTRKFLDILKKVLLFNLTAPNPEASDPSSAPFAEGTKKPFWFFISTVIPMVILSLLFFNGYYFIHQEMDDSNICAFWSLQGIFLLDIVIFTLFPIILIRKKRCAKFMSYAMMLVLQVALIVVAVRLLSEVRPRAVNDFIFPNMKYICYLFTFFMPSLMHVILGISVSIPLKRLLLGLGISAGAVVVIPIAFYYLFCVCVAIGSRSRWKFWKDPVIEEIMSICTIVMAVFFLACFMIAVMYLLIALYRYMETRAAKKTLVLFAVLILPYAGLLLNIVIPFPVNFQDWRVYAMTAVNAFFLLLPMPRNKLLSAIVFFGRGASYIFTLYFFLVFLPYLPLFLPAVIAAGAGFLILAPTVLFHVHTRTLIEDFRRLLPVFGRWRVWWLFIVSLAVIPSYITFNAFRDRALVDRGLKLIYAADYDGSRMTPSEINRLKRVVSDIYNYKNGIEAPYLTGFYQWIAFDNMVLSDSKLKDMYFKLSGTEIRLPRESPFSFSSEMRSKPRLRSTEKRLPDGYALLDEPGMSYEFLPDGTCRCTIALRVKSSGWTGREAVLDINIPEGIFVSGLSLKIGKEFVKGRIFEKKSAQWIYEKILNENRDPALLYYVSDNYLRLHVFPVNEPRDLKLELIFPADIFPLITVKDKKIALNQFKNGIPRKVPEYSGFAVFDPAFAPEIKRKPVLCFIVDASVPSLKRIPRLDNLMANISKKTGITDFSLVYASMYPETAIASGRFDDGLPKLPAPSVMPGGFMAERVVKTEILKWRNDKDAFPVFVVISGNNNFKSESCDFAGFGNLLPETGYIFFSDEKGEKIRMFELGMNRILDFSGIRYHPVCKHPELGIVRKDSFYCFPDAKSQSGIYGDALRLKAKNLEIRLKPSLMERLYPEIVKESKRIGVVVPATSYIVLERDSQWKALEAAEKKKLMADKNLDLEETPEPGVFILGGLLVLSFMILRKFRKKYLRFGC